MSRNHPTTFTQIGDVLARLALPELHPAARAPLRVTCIGVASYDGCEEADSFDRTVAIGEAPTPEDAMCLASQRVSRGDIRIGAAEALRFQPCFAVILDREHGLVLAGAIRAGIIVWQDPVSSNAEARRVVTDASRSLEPPWPSRRGFSFQEPDMANHYTHFSCLLDVGTPDNAAQALDLYNRLSREGASEDPPSEGFLLSIQPEHGGTRLWMRDDVTGDPERLIQFVKLCAAEFGLTGRWGFQYADTCSQPRVNAFGGRAHVLDLATGDTVAWTYTDGWLVHALDGDDPNA